MSRIYLRRIVNAIGLAVALIISAAVPAGYFLVSYSNMSHELSVRSHLTADRLAKYVYRYRQLWQYQAPRLAELIEMSVHDSPNFAQEVRDLSGRLIIHSGPRLNDAVLVRNFPIVVGGETVGRVDAMSSITPLYEKTALVALASILFGLGAYFAIRVFPLRVLDRTLYDLHTTERDLARQNERLDTALTNMSQGLCMFDANGKLVIHNARFLEIYGLVPEAVRSGMTAPQLMTAAFGPGKVSDVDPEGTLAMREAIVRERKAGSFTERLTDGRSISISYRPMPAGGFVTTFEDITGRLQAEEKIRHLAHFDALTDLPNRVFFYEQMEMAVGQLRRSKSVAVLSLDLDHFKNVNDTLGHPVGDELLKQVAARMRSCLRGEDIAARLGGDEFAIVQVSSEEPNDVTALAARLIEVVGSPYEIDGHQVVVGASIGIALVPHDGHDPDVLMKNADLALYRAKADGGGVYRFFEEEMDARMQARRALELDLRKAIVVGEFELNYQPIVDVKSGRITSCEALIRWNHPKRGMISPLEFIPVAEATGLIVTIGEWVLRHACAEAARWPTDVTIAVNVSPAQFKSRNLVPTVIGALASSGLPASRLELEITETVLLADNEGAFAILHQLRSLGIKIAMDDFGTGYSSLGYLRSFPFDKIKIDRSFIQDLPNKGDSVAIVRAVVGLSSSLGITTTAEGVETKEQLESLTTEGCNEVQGFLFSRPRPAAEVQRLLREQAPRAAQVA